MVAENSTAFPVQSTDRGNLHVKPGLAEEGVCGTLILDEKGNICSCGIAAGRLFGGNLSGFMGKPVSSLIPDLVLHNTSQSYSARYFAHLCADGGWRKFEAIDVMGHEFPIEINLSLVETKAQGVLLLSVRRLKLYQ